MVRVLMFLTLKLADLGVCGFFMSGINDFAGFA